MCRKHSQFIRNAPCFMSVGSIVSILMYSGHTRAEKNKPSSFKWTTQVLHTYVQLKMFTSNNTNGAWMNVVTCLLVTVGPQNNLPHRLAGHVKGSVYLNYKNNNFCQHAKSFFYLFISVFQSATVSW